jgi:predicted adenylyl cyclase CyaB
MDRMARNVEIKARAEDLANLRSKVASLAPLPPEVVLQSDTFFVVSRGRLKLRHFSDGTGELIFYERPDHTHPRESSYIRCDCPDPFMLSALLSRTLGVRGVVEKRREVFMLGRTRLHLDDVRGLGSFVEIEVVLEDGEAVAEGEKVMHGLLATLGIAESSLVGQAYIDLLEAARTPS